VVRIAATIFVEREGQKAILIGAGGAQLKQIGVAARGEIELLLGRKVYLELFVRVRSNWREDPRFVAEVDWRSKVGT
jgi:GTP-binding protein Era